MKQNILEIQKQDIIDAITADTVLPMFNNGKLFVIRHNGINFTIQFDDEGQCIGWDCAPPSDECQGFLNLHGDKYTFSYVRLLDGAKEDDKFLLYAQPKEELPWMLRTHGEQIWCIGRWFPRIGKAGHLMNDILTSKDIEVKWFCRIVGYDDYHPMVNSDAMNTYDPYLQVEPSSDIPC